MNRLYNKAVNYSVITAWLITAIAILLIAIILVTQGHRSSYFWLRVVWLEILCFFFWSGSASFFLSSTKQTDQNMWGGMVPSVSIVTTIYCALSFLTMITSAYMDNSEELNQWHLIIQILLFSIMAIMVIFLFISRASAATGLNFDQEKSEPLKFLHDVIFMHESMLPNTQETSYAKSTLKNLRETIKFSLNANSKLSDRSEYKALCDEVKTLCDSIEILSSEKNIDSQKIIEISESAIYLLNKTKLINAKQVIR